MCMVIATTQFDYRTYIIMIPEHNSSNSTSMIGVTPDVEEPYTGIRKAVRDIMLFRQYF